MTKKEIRRYCDFWMLFSLNDAIRYTEKGYPTHMIHEALERARMVMLMAESMKVISANDFDAINTCLAYTSLNA